ncbi:MAG: hypothetical protein ACM3ML_23215 [Micromonosporaceae bacterium]
MIAMQPVPMAAAADAVPAAGHLPGDAASEAAAPAIVTGVPRPGGGEAA